MPELPEVETIKRILAPQMTGQQILSVTIANPQIIAYPDAAAFARRLTGQTVQGMSRRGKFLTIHLQNGDRVALHLRMTGQLLVTPADFPDEKHTHLIAQLSGGNQIRYMDVRRFGRFWYLKTDEPNSLTGQDQLGPEPLDDALTGAYLEAKLGSRKKAVKEMLLDQSVVAGVGNIYSDEILSAAALNPQERCCDLTAADWDCLAQNIKEIIRWGIRTDEMAPEEYLHGMGKEYSNIPNLRVYGREGLPCKQCGAAIARVVMGGRSSYYCPHCQRKKA